MKAPKNDNWKFAFSSDLADHIPSKSKDRETARERYRQKKASKADTVRGRTWFHAMNDLL
jgi:DNA polymerase IIIc chi subunit